MEKTNKKEFLDWFVGFSEGDGSWQVDPNQKTRRSIFIINQKDPQILYKIKSFIGFGQINGPYKNKNGSIYYRYRVGNIKGTERLIEIFNGNLVLTKTEKRFKGYLDMYNSRVTVSKEIKFKPSSRVVRLNDGWLSGFIDAEGSFSGTTMKYTGTDEIRGVKVRFSLVQKFEKEVFKNLKSLLGGSLSSGEGDIFRLLIESKKGRNDIISYLEKFPLRSSKTIAFTRFKKLHVRLTDGDFKWRLSSPRAKERIITLVKNINKDI